jgi:hypothetical protein
MTSFSAIGKLKMKGKSVMVHTEIQIKGKLSQTWADWFEDMQLCPMDSGDMLLCGELPDKAAVYGVLSRLSNLGISLISVICRDESSPDPPG